MRNQLINSTPSKKTKNILGDLFGQFQNNNQSQSNTDPSNEFKVYLDKASNSMEFDDEELVDWWNNKQTN